ncbi:MAG: DUF748 domain-containing protein [Pseudomonadota bacterium]
MTQNRLARHRTAVIVGVILLLLVGLRAALPSIVKDQINSRLASLEEYSGHLEDIDLALWRGEYNIVNLVIEKRGIETTEPFVWVPRAAISLEWRALLEGAVVGEVELFAPEIHLIAADNPAQEQIGAGVRWYSLLEELVPFTINRFEVQDGHFRLDDADVQRPLNVHIHDIDALATNLSNASDTDADSFASAALTGLFDAGTPLTINGQLSPLADPPVFEVDVQVETLPLTELNGLLNAYIGVDAEAGEFSVFAEFASANGRFEGYIKPILANAEFFSLGEEENLLRNIWEGIVAVTAVLLQNQPEDQFASVIPFSGELADVDAGILSAMLSILRNAFVTALELKLDNTVEIENLGADGQ